MCTGTRDPLGDGRTQTRHRGKTSKRETKQSRGDSLGAYRLVEVQDAAAQGHRDCLSAVAHLELFENILHVHFNSIFGD